MKLSVVAVGKCRDERCRELVSEYSERLAHYVQFEELEVKEGRGNPEAVVKAEADALREAAFGAGAGSQVIALDEGGKSWSSRDLAQYVNDQMLYGTRYISFIIGGAHGLQRDLRRDCDFTLSLSDMTFPHEIARVLLVEQLYRTMTIIRGEPYHK